MELYHSNSLSCRKGLDLDWNSAIPETRYADYGRAQVTCIRKGRKMINIRLDYVLLDRRMKLKDLAAATGLAVNNLSILKTNKARAIRFSTLELLCKVLNCTPGDLIEFIPEAKEDSQPDEQSI